MPFEPVLAIAALVAAYMVTPVAKEAWIALAPVTFGVAAPVAFVVLLAAEATIVTLVLVAFPAERLARLAPRIERVTTRVRESRLARRSLGGALAVAIALPFHSGGAILGTLGGRAMGLPRVVTFCAVLGGIAARFSVVLLGYLGWIALR